MEPYEEYRRQPVTVVGIVLFFVVVVGIAIVTLTGPEQPRPQSEGSPMQQAIPDSEFPEQPDAPAEVGP